MTITIDFGWWLFPLAVTFAACTAAYFSSPTRRPPTGYGNIGDGIVAMFLWGPAVIVSLIAWLIWAVLA